MTLYLVIIKTALPIILSRLVQTIGLIISGLMVAQLGHKVLAACAIANAISIALFTFCSGSLFSLASLIAKYHAQRNYKEIAVTLIQGLYFALGLSLIVMVIFYHIHYLLKWFNQPLALIDLVSHYYYYFAPSIIPMLFTTALQECLIACHQQLVVFKYSIIRLLFGVGLNYCFIFGHLGIPALGYSGLGLAINTASWCGCGGLFCYMLIRYQAIVKPLITTTVFKFTSKLSTIIKLGLPIGFQMSGEMVAITIATLLIGKFGVYALASQQITLQYLLLVTMFPFGMAHALTVLVSKAINHHDYSHAIALRNKSIVLIIFITLPISILYLGCPKLLAQIFIYRYAAIDYTQVMNLSIKFFYILAIYQVMDGVRNIIAGVLYGYGQTVATMLYGLGAFWLLGIPSALLFAFYFKLGVIAIPCSLTFAVSCACLLSFAYCLKLGVIKNAAN